ncbi:hypothetical protein HELRODRAFT_179712 [Helobdella robusta]|uniref:Uncharacterized protein n=1 Tax=Helobdella robusta TaxID=6412 RepID=T1FF21_HELRO|nr:hypothetical protein HELRODRAFT_179712 [Helobdella robusta]ESN95119.1 hypothetical protein HELRODRAFT_179712 [Helobdella robusta]
MAAGKKKAPQHQPPQHQQQQQQLQQQLQQQQQQQQQLKSQKCPDGCTLIPWRAGRCLAWDVTVPSTLAERYVNLTSKECGFAAARAADGKMKKYGNALPSMKFLPICIEVLGPMDPNTLKFLKAICKMINEAIDDMEADVDDVTSNDDDEFDAKVLEFEVFDPKTKQNHKGKFVRVTGKPGEGLASNPHRCPIKYQLFFDGKPIEENALEGPNNELANLYDEGGDGVNYLA